MKYVRRFRDAAAIDHRLAVILTRRLKRIDLEQAVGRRIEPRQPDFLLDMRIRDLQWTARDKARIAKS